MEAGTDSTDLALQGMGQGGGFVREKVGVELPGNLASGNGPYPFFAVELTRRAVNAVTQYH